MQEARLVRAAVAVLVAGALAAAGCSRQAGEGAGIIPPRGGGAPVGLVVSAVGFDEVSLGWRTPATDERVLTALHFEVEQRVPPAGWVRLRGDLPGYEPYLVVPLDPAMPELTTIDFRVRGVLADGSSDWTEISFLRGVRAPAAVTATAAMPWGEMTRIRSP